MAYLSSTASGCSWKTFQTHFDALLKQVDKQERSCILPQINLLNRPFTSVFSYYFRLAHKYFAAQ